MTQRILLRDLDVPDVGRLEVCVSKRDGEKV